MICGMSHKGWYMTYQGWHIWMHHITHMHVWMHHIWMNYLQMYHITHMNISNMKRHHIWMRHIWMHQITHMHESCRRCYVSHINTSSNMNESCNTFPRSTPHARNRRVTHINEPRHTYEIFIMFHIWIRHATDMARIRRVTHINEPCHTST